MERSEFVRLFSRRLTARIKDVGHGVARSPSGVNIQKLSEIAGCSYQMARKYVMGEALPELNIITTIASWLEVSPSWLLFGENDTKVPELKSGAMIEIEPDLLKYIINKSVMLFSFIENKENVTNFIVETIYDATHLHADKATTYKIIDMMISSAALLNGQVYQEKEVCNL